MGEAFVQYTTSYALRLLRCNYMMFNAFSIESLLVQPVSNDCHNSNLGNFHTWDQVHNQNFAKGKGV